MTPFLVTTAWLLLVLAVGIYWASRNVDAITESLGLFYKSAAAFAVVAIAPSLIAAAVYA